ncbi:MAG: hypothetical protein MPJ06_08510 [Nitrosopumilus sp.]|nr:hypothetical protein [Nitrosopumilus sp.]MDA7944021.1 hypothetical protein [Nitrosopumilus sp.]MDA7959711.1 hypothetical protein [Nitrosopumilus sp.]
MIFSETSPPEITDNDNMFHVHEDYGPVVLVWTACDAPASSIRAFTQLFDSHIPIHFHSIVWDRRYLDTYDLDVKPCRGRGG